MKRIVSGVTYNTETSSVLASWEWEEGENQVTTEFGTDVLYQTRGGAFFLHKSKTTSEWDEGERAYQKRTKDEFVPLSPEQAHAWLLEGDVEVISNPFDDPPEAATEAEPGATIYIRVPASLKKRVDEAAGAEGVSGNVWSMRCVERCLSKKVTHFGSEMNSPEEAPVGQWILARWQGESGVAFKDADGQWWCGAAGAPKMKRMTAAPIGWERIVAL